MSPGSQSRHEPARAPEEPDPAQSLLEWAEAILERMHHNDYQTEENPCPSLQQSAS